MNEQDAYALAEQAISSIYETNDGNDAVMEYHDRHDVNSLLILTVSEYYGALKEIELLWPRIKDKTVVEIGAGCGMLAIQLAKFAKRVYAIEADPAWSWVFTQFFYALKPPNLTFIFGRAQELVGTLHADVAVVYTNSDVEHMMELGKQFAPVAIRGPLCSFDKAHLASPEDLTLAERVASRLKLSDVGIRGIDPTALNAAILAEMEQGQLA